MRTRILAITDEEFKSPIGKVVREDVRARASMYWLALGVSCSKFPMKAV